MVVFFYVQIKKVNWIVCWDTKRPLRWERWDRFAERGETSHESDFS